MNFIKSLRSKSKVVHSHDSIDSIDSTDSMGVDRSESIVDIDLYPNLSMLSIAPLFDYTIKCIIVGDSGVGKSSLLLQYMEHSFVPTHEITVGVEFGIKIINVDSKRIKLQIWDTAGQENFRSITKSYYRDARIVILVYDITSVKSFTAVHFWYEDIMNVIEYPPQILLIGNKTDLNDRREVSYDLGCRYAIENDMLFIETSAKKAMNIEEAFTSITNKAVKYIDFNTLNPTDSIKLNHTDQKKKCCSN